MTLTSSGAEADAKCAMLRRFGEFIHLDDSELDALARAVVCRREYPRKKCILHQGDPVSEVYAVIEGWIGCSVEVDFERHQLAKIHLPGEIAGLPNIALKDAASSLIALTPVVVGVVPLDRLGRLFETAPRLALTLFVSAQQERVMLMDHLAAVGQTSATQRLCALLLHVHQRLKVVDPDCGDRIVWPLSQENMAQGAGLTAIHVNRTLRNLVRRRLIAREGKTIRLLDIDRIREIAALPQRRFVHEPSWLTSVERTFPTREPES